MCSNLFWLNRGNIEPYIQLYDMPDLLIHFAKISFVITLLATDTDDIMRPMLKKLQKTLLSQMYG